MKVITTNVFIALTCITCTQVERTYEQSQKDITEEVDYLKPYLARIGNPSELTRDSAYLLKYECLEDYKQLLVDRANKVLHRFDEYSQKLAKIQTLLTQVKNLLFYKTSDRSAPVCRFGPLLFARIELVESTAPVGQGRRCVAEPSPSLFLRPSPTWSEPSRSVNSSATPNPLPPPFFFFRRLFVPRLRRFFEGSSGFPLPRRLAASTPLREPLVDDGATTTRRTQPCAPFRTHPRAVLLSSSPSLFLSAPRFHRVRSLSSLNNPRGNSRPKHPRRGAPCSQHVVC